MKKWISKSLFIVVFISSTASVYHPLKMSTTSVVIDNNKLSLKIKIFADDLTQGMGQYAKKPMSYETKGLTNEAKSLLKKYVLENISLQINSATPLEWEYKDIRTDFANPSTPVVYVELSSKKAVSPNTISQIKMRNTILFQYSPEQKNVVNFIKIKNDSDKILVFSNEENHVYLDLSY